MVRCRNGTDIRPDVDRIIGLLKTQIGIADQRVSHPSVADGWISGALPQTLYLALMPGLATLQAPCVTWRLSYLDLSPPSPPTPRAVLCANPSLTFPLLAQCLGAPVGASLLAVLDQRVAELALGCVLLAVAIMQCASSSSSHEGRTRSLQADDDGKQIRSGDLEQPLLLAPSSEEAAEPTPGSHAAGTLTVLLRDQGREVGSLAGCLSLDCLSALDYIQSDQQVSLLAGKPGGEYIATVHQEGCWIKHETSQPSAVSCQESGCFLSNSDSPLPSALRDVRDGVREPPTGAILSQINPNCSDSSHLSDFEDAAESSGSSVPLGDAAPAPAPVPAPATPTDDSGPAKPRRRVFRQTVTRFLMGSIAGTLSGVMAGLTVSCALLRSPCTGSGCAATAYLVHACMLPSTSVTPPDCASQQLEISCNA